MAAMPRIVTQLVDLLGEGDVLRGEALATRSAHVWESAPLTALALVRPRSVAALSATLKACHAAGQSVVTHGGLTGLVQGTESTSQDIVVSLERMDAIESIDALGRTITVQAGAVLQNVQHALAEQQLQLGLDLGARGSCTIGGNISTNAGGLSVLRHGMMRDQVLGLEAVLADGTVVSSMNQLIKNNTGLDLKQLFIGTEGTLGIITRAVLKVRTATPHVKTVLVACERFEHVTDLLAHLGSAWGDGLSAFEIMWNRFYRLNTDAGFSGHVEAPLAREFPLYVIAELAVTHSDTLDSRFDAALGSALTADLIADAVVAQSDAERQRIWRLRENVDTQRQHTPVFTYDVSLPIPAMPSYLQHVEDVLVARWPHAHMYAYGHLADGNLHIVVGPLPMGTAPEPSEDTDRWHRECSDIVYAPLAAIGGSISAEHGIGKAKKPWLNISRSDDERALMTQIKQLLDPQSILNPGLIL